ncbi:hypothetical protein [Serinibacter salmoneus]|uniref:Uncharacterized protein n=1 Tax=Serinibacter salmoneus TaxID=556530 RepID=A0A2A9CX90_9MICO|nr:hypothetical protein [Serinibacter salmoneus]PFG19057.1 hypothetical protein ATL40_0611 [Serinibacter salmoneus]
MDTTPHATRKFISLAAGIALTATLAACNNSTDDGSGGDLTWEDSPISQEFASIEALTGTADMSDAEWQALYDASTVRAEELTAECMAEQGFEYIPTDLGSSSTTVLSDEDTPEWGTLEFAEQYGYGTFTWEDSYDETIEEDGAEEWTDPNAEIIESMSESEYVAWSEALYGAPQDMESDPDADLEDFEWNWEDYGCSGWAQHETEQDLPGMELAGLTEDPRFQELFEGMSTLYEDAAADPKMGELDATWAECMAEAGYDFRTPADAEQSIYDLTETIWGSQDEYVEPTDDVLAEAKAQEIATAVDDYTCRSEVDYDSGFLAIQFEHEEAYLEENRALFEEFIAAAEQFESESE